MNSLTLEGITFKEIERIFFEIGCEVSRMLMQQFLEKVDKELAESRNKSEFRHKGGRDTTLKTLMGEVPLRRVLYKRINEDGGSEHIYYSKKYDKKAKADRANVIAKAQNLIENPGKYTRATSRGAGAVFKRWKTKTGTPEHIDFNMTSREIWEKEYREHFLDFDVKRLDIEKIGKPDVIWLYEDMGDTNGLFCNPQILTDLFLPYYKEIVDFFHSYDLPVVLHSCGGINDAMPMILEAGFDGLNPMEAKAGCDVVDFAEKYGDKLTLIGGMDIRIFESGDRDAIKKEVERIYYGVKKTGANYFFGTDHSVSTGVKFEDYVYALNIFKELT